MSGPKFVKYFGPVIDALKSLGDSGTPAEVREIVTNKLNFTDETLNEQIKSGSSRFDNQVAWARFYLVKAGYIDASERGVWSLTDKGKNANIDSNSAYSIFREVQRQFKTENLSNMEEAISETETPPDADAVPEDYRTKLLELIRALSPGGFERLCQRLLRESGFQQVEVTGRSGDGGLDGNGILQVNRLMSFRVFFQCKRYSNPITPSQVRDFRGAMMGRADKGIFITTSTYTSEARKEAIRDGVPPIELIDADKLLTMFEELNLGLMPKIIYEIDHKFFDEFK